MMLSVGSRRTCLRLAHHDASARQALADIVVGIADQFQRHAARQEGAEGLAGGAGEADRDRVFRQAGMAVALGHFARQHGADGAVDIADGALQPHRLAVFDRGQRGGDQVVIERRFQAVILRFAMMDGDAGLGRAR